MSRRSWVARAQTPTCFLLSPDAGAANLATLDISSYRNKVSVWMRRPGLPHINIVFFEKIEHHWEMKMVEGVETTTPMFPPEQDSFSARKNTQHAIRSGALAHD